MGSPCRALAGVLRLRYSTEIGTETLGRLILFFGVMLVAVGGFLVLLGKLPWVGRLPGDIFVQRDNFSFYFPITTSILVSLLLTVVLNLFWRR